MSDNIGHCPLCGGEKQLGTTTFAVDLKSGVVVVREVPAFVCTKCGDVWIDDPVAPWWRSCSGNRWRRDVCPYYAPRSYAGTRSGAGISPGRRNGKAASIRSILMPDPILLRCDE
jgi:YgiT-type zinc finger domain-containing protein